MTLKVATIISRVFDPFIMLGVGVFVLLYTSPAFLPAFLLMVLLPLILFVVAVKTKFVSNWDLSIRHERPKVVWPLVIIELFGSIFFHISSFAPILFIMICFAIITHVWKISGHSTAAALATGIIVEEFGLSWWPVLLIVPLVGWSRVVRRDHTVTQVIAGAAYSWFLLVVLLL